MTVAEQVQYESRVRSRYAVIAFSAAVLIVGAQLLNLSGTHPPVTELTLELLSFNQRSTLELLGAVVNLLGLGAVGALLYWLHQIASARRPELKPFVRWVAVGGAALAGVLALAYNIVLVQKAHQFATTGNQSYPEANHLTGSGLMLVLPLILELGTFLLTIGCIWTSLSALRVGLVTKPVGYAGVIAGALFLFPLGPLVPVVQGFWFAALAVLLARRWPSGDPPAWEAGVAVPWPSAQRAQPQQNARTARGQRRRVSDEDVLEAVQSSEAPPNPRAGRSKRKRKR